MTPRFGRFTLAAAAASFLLAGCGGSQPMTGSPAVTAARSASRVAERSSLDGYYSATLTTIVGNGIPGASLCFRFKPNGTWSSSGSVSFTGTYLVSGSDFFASAVWLPSPPVFLSFEGSVNAKHGFGKFANSSVAGQVSGGGTFTMIRNQNKGCA